MYTYHLEQANSPLRGVPPSGVSTPYGAFQLLLHFNYNYNDDYNYSSDDYPNGDGDDNTNTYPSETEKIIHRTPLMKSKNSDELINEGNIIRLSCVVDNIGMSELCI